MYKSVGVGRRCVCMSVWVGVGRQAVRVCTRVWVWAGGVCV